MNETNEEESDEPERKEKGSRIVEWKERGQRKGNVDIRSIRKFH